MTINRTIFVHQKIRRREAAQAILRLAFGADDAPPVIAYVLRVHAARFANASDRLLKRFGDRRSFTDWTTLALLDEERIDRVATFDRWFAGRAEVVDGT